MLIEERLNKIVEIIKINDSARIEDLTKALDVSKDTIRRDLIRLENEKIIKRTHGGAVLNNRRASAIYYDKRKNQNLESKRAMGESAAKLIKEDASIIFDASTTVESVIPFLDKKNIYAVTNSLATATELSKLKSCQIFMLPGRLDNDHLYITGADTVQKLLHFSVDYLLLGVSAIDHRGIYTISENEGIVKEQMLDSSEKTIVMADSSKFDTTGLVRICGLEKIDFLVTDTIPEEKLLDSLKKANVEIIVSQ